MIETKAASKECSDLNRTIGYGKLGYTFQYLKDDGSKKQGKASKSKSKKIVVAVYPFHGKMSVAERDSVVNYESNGVNRIIVFTTNYAETGLTIPKIRYVIDTGLERRAQYNYLTNMTELITMKTTKSSEKQRTGRAGRTASGLVIRLYDKNNTDRNE